MGHIVCYTLYVTYCMLHIVKSSLDFDEMGQMIQFTSETRYWHNIVRSKKFNPDGLIWMLLITKFNISLDSFCLIKRLIIIYVGMGNWCPVKMPKTDAFDHKNAIQPKPRRLKCLEKLWSAKMLEKNLELTLIHIISSTISRMWVNITGVN